ncbi:hypothetical protein SteCoe_1954 [Stentor coeruleus]|uniref:Ubiquitin thioesterase OTU n=1 Tax=Stentor coeruleus TaxID=5963 RepID=A0A1R2D0K7_9CILI|nr:hypothetical protein SteCoe_1954 [Stentor coeruleus]
MLGIIINFESQSKLMKVPRNATMGQFQYNIAINLGIEIEFQYLLVKDVLIIPESSYQIINYFDNGDTCVLKTLNLPFKEFLRKNSGLDEVELTRLLLKEFDVAHSTQKFFDGSVIVIRHIPNDNSCLFTAMHYAMNRNFDSSGYLRDYIGAFLKKNPDKFEEGILGRSIEEYSQWIKNTNNWGGEIELVILSEYFEVEICIISVNPISESFINEDKSYHKRIYLLFTNAHYNLIVRNFPDGDLKSDVTRFSKNPYTHSLVLDAANNFRSKNIHKELVTFICRDCYKQKYP